MKNETKVKASPHKNYGIGISLVLIYFVGSRGWRNYGIKDALPTG
ncbi:hypothetical protein [Sporosarcina sp. P20a]|nr:hypothetical protein [Sporosarcina sp. P20a]